MSDRIILRPWENRLRRVLTGFVAAVLVILVGVTTYLANRPTARVVVVLCDRTGEYKAIGDSVTLGASFQHESLPRLPDDTTLELRVVDDRGSDLFAQKAALRIAADPRVLAVIGTSTSGSTASALRILGPQSIPLLCPVATSPDITTTAANLHWTSVFRLVPSDDLQATQIASFCQRRSWNRMFVLSDDSRYGKTLAEFLPRALGDVGIDVPTTLTISKFIRGQTDYSKLVPQLQQYTLSAIVFAGYYQEGGALVRQLREAGFTLPIVLTDGCYVDGIFDVLGKPYPDTYVAFVAPPWSSMPDLGPLLQYVTAAGRHRDTSYAPFAADAIAIIHKTSRTVINEGTQLTRHSLLVKLQSERDHLNGLLSGPCRFNSKGDNELARNYMYKLAASATNKLSWVPVQ